MSKGRAVVTDAFLAKVIREGSLARAAESVLQSRRMYERLPAMTTWELVCEEIVDTEYSPEEYERVVAELFFRGISFEELQDMRKFAWQTAGWLNFEMMIWDWCGLDDNDIRRALAWQLKKGEITEAEWRRGWEYAKRYGGGIHLGTSLERESQRGNWKFDQPWNSAAITTAPVMEKHEDVLFVTHDADGGWRFHGATQGTVENARVVALAEMTRSDRTLLAVSDLPIGWCAVRSKIGDTWERSVNQHPQG